MISIFDLKERKAIESTYEDVCKIYEYKKVKDNSITKNTKTVKYDNIKCALSQKVLNTTNSNNIVNTINYDAKLFLSPEIYIPPGCYIEVKRLNQTYNFISSGEAFIYKSHQEVMLQRRDTA